MSAFSKSNITGAAGSSISHVSIYDECDSTNLRALEYAREHGCSDAVFIADSQTAGRGRLGRSFISPGGRGIYLSVLTDRIPSGEDAVSVTAYAAVAVSRAIEKLTSLKTEIKWVNDIYVGGKKVAGILTQGVVDPERGKLAGVVVGIGINVLGTELSPEIRDIATTLELAGDAPERESLACEIISELLGGLAEVGTAECAEEYRRLSFLIDRDITVIRESGSYCAHVLGITDRCELILRLESGEREILATGEVSVREKARTSK